MSFSCIFEDVKIKGRNIPTRRMLLRYIINLLIISYIIFSFPLCVQAQEEILRMMIWEGYAPDKFVLEFEQEINRKYGKRVKLEITYIESADDFFDPVRDKKVDLVSLSHHQIKDERFDYISKGLILPVNLENIPNFTYLIPDLKRADYHTSDGKIYSVPVANGPYGLAYNTKEFEQAPESWDVLWDPAYQNRYVIGAHEYLYNVNIAALVMGYPRESISSIDLLNNLEFREKLRGLASNADHFWIGVDKPVDYKEMSIVASWGDALTALKREGKFWKMAEPKEGTLWWIDDYAITWALADKPFLKQVAEEWINKVLSSEFQIENIVREVGIFPVVTNISSQLTDDEKVRVLENKPGSFDATRILQQTHSQRDRNGLKLLWDEAMKDIPINEASE
jgi:putative spermidine/putrescine transport system substrate-binding protein